MKKWPYILSLLVLILTSCKKDNTWHYIERRPDLAINSLAVLDHTDSLLIGNWILDSAWNYKVFPAVAFFTNAQYYSDPNNCHLQLSPNLTTVNCYDNINWKAGINGLFCGNTPANWKVINGYLNIFSQVAATIKSVSSNKLVLYCVLKAPLGCQEGKAVTFYLHK